MAQDSGKMVQSTDVYEMPWERPGGTEDQVESAMRMKGLFDKLDSDNESESPQDDERARADEAPESDGDDDAGTNEDDSEAEDAGQDDGTDAEEDDSEADDEDDETDDSDDEDEDEEEAAEPDPNEVIDLGGGEKVTRQELRDRGFRQADYTRKTQALAEERKKFENEEVPAIREAREQYRVGLENLHAALQEAQGQAPNWIELAKTLDPKEFQARKAEWEARESQRQRVAAEHSRVAKEQEDDFIAQHNTRVESAREALHEAIPEWKQDPAVADREKGEMYDYALSLGFTPQQLEMVENHQLFLLLRDSMLYRRKQENAAEVKKEVEEAVAETAKRKRKGLKPGTRQGKGKRTKAAEKRVKDAKSELARTGSLAAAARFYESIMPD